MNTQDFFSVLQELINRKSAEKAIEPGQALLLSDLSDEQLVEAIISERTMEMARRAEIARQEAAATESAAAEAAAQLAVIAMGANLTGIITAG